MDRAVVDAPSVLNSGTPGLFRAEAIAHRSARTTETLDTSKPKDLIGLAAFFLVIFVSASCFLSSAAKDARQRPVEGLEVVLDEGTGCSMPAGFSVPLHAGALTVRTPVDGLRRPPGDSDEASCAAEDVAISGLLTLRQGSPPIDPKDVIRLTEGGRVIVELSNVRFHQRTARSYVISGTFRREGLKRICAAAISRRPDVRVMVVSSSKSMAELFRTHLFRRSGGAKHDR